MSSDSNSLTRTSIELLNLNHHRWSIVDYCIHCIVRMHCKVYMLLTTFSYGELQLQRNCSHIRIISWLSILSLGCSSFDAVITCFSSTWARSHDRKLIQNPSCKCHQRIQRKVDCNFTHCVIRLPHSTKTELLINRLIPPGSLRSGWKKIQ